jgi:type II secretory pathway pseudopilin PulG
MTGTRLRQASGLTLVEVLVTILVVTSGALVTLGTFANFSQSARKAQRHAVMVSLAQREIEEMRPLRYEQLGLAAEPSPSATVEAPRRGNAAGEPLVLGGVVRPGGDPFSIRGARGRIYRYVTWRNQSCPAINAKVGTQLSGVLGVDVSAQVGDLCAGTAKTKRIMVVVVPEADGRPAGAVRLSSIAVDPAGATPAVANYAGLTVQQALANVPAAGGPPVPPPSTQAFQLHDTRCDAPSRTAPTAHATHDTSQIGATCAATGSRPDLMSTAAIPGAPTDPVLDFAQDVVRPARGGAILMRDDRNLGCTDPAALQYPPGEAARYKRSVHTWSTPASTVAFETPLTAGRGSVTLWTSTAAQLEASGRLCLVVRRASSGEVVGWADYVLPRWPAEPTRLTIAFDVAHTTFSAGERLLLSLRVPSDSQSDLQVLYDHPLYASNLTLTTAAGREFG